MSNSSTHDNVKVTFYSLLLCLFLGLTFTAKLVGTQTLDEDDMIALGMVQTITGLVLAAGIVNLLWYFRSKMSAIVTGTALCAGLIAGIMLNWTDKVTMFTHGLLH